jgi:light-regulated signal transduction histidine kinase (bacteriophytochrome)
LLTVLSSAIKARERQYQVRDLVSQLESVAVKLEESNRALQDFAYIASHDLQEPLRKIETFGGLLASEFASISEEQGKDYLGRMQNAAARMRAFIQDLLNYSRVSTKVEPPRRLNLKTIVQDVLSELEVSISQTHANIKIGDLPQVNADPVQMHQLFQNLIGNALKFHGNEQPAIEVSSPGCSDAICEIHVTDNGIGFDQKYAERVFAPFQRLHGRSRYEGSGMGLAICKKIVERHGGTIRAESISGKGATFIIDLPTG